MPADLTKFELPCTDPERMNDWHITEKAPLPPEDEADIRIMAATAYQMDASTKHTPEGERKAGDRAVSDAVTDLLARRRHAVEACRLDCPMKARLLCLDEGLKPVNLEHGIWGGYDAPERREIVKAIREHKKAISTGTAARIMIQAEKE